VKILRKKDVNSSGVHDMSCWFGELSYEIWVNPIHLNIKKKIILIFFKQNICFTNNSR